MNPVNQRILWPFARKIKSEWARPSVVRPQLESIEERIAPAFTFQFNLDFDRAVNVTAGRGFITQAMLDLAKEAGADLAAKFQDSLSALPTNEYRIPNPTNPSILTPVTTKVDQNQLLVYLAGAPLNGKEESYSYSDFDPSAANFRGQRNDKDFAPNVSMISIDNDGTTNWDLKSDVGKAHFKGVITHELMHAMGILRKQPTWAGKISNGVFRGDAVRDLFPAGLPVEPGLNPVHFASGSGSLMTPQGAGVDIRDLTAVDMAVLKDIGWEPATNKFSRAAAQPLLFAGEKPGPDISTMVDLATMGGRVLYRFEALHGFQYEFTTKGLTSLPESTVDTYLRLFDSNGIELASNDDGAVTRSFSKLTYQVENGGTYYLGVSLFSNKNYIISPPVSKPDAVKGTFLLQAKVTDPFDAGGSFETAKALSSEAFIRGTYKNAQSLSNQYDVDIYKINLKSNETVSIMTAFTNTPGERKVDTYLRLFRSDGREILRSDDDGGDGYAKLIFTSKTAGDYFIGVSSTLNQAYSPVRQEIRPGRFGGDYILSLNRQMALPILQPDSNVPAGDHYLDVSYLSADGTWFVLQNTQGHGALQPQKWGQWNQSATWLDVNAGDFNGDGLIDRIGRTPEGQWWMAKNLGSSFENVFLGSWKESLGYQDVLVGDFYDDPRSATKIMDIAARDATGTWCVFPLDSGGISESTKIKFATVASGAAWKNITALDYNLDGYLDIIGRDTNGAWRLLKNEGSLFSIMIVGHWNKNANWRDVKFADFSGDGLIDIAGRESNGQWWISTNLQNDEFTSAPAWKWNEASGWRDVMLGDFAGDSRLDIIGRAANGEWWVAPTVDVNLSVLPVSNKGNVSPFTSRLLGRWGKPGQWSSTVLVGNFIGGGKADLIGLTKSGEWWISQNTGTGLVSSTFFADQRLIIPTPIYGAAAGFFVAGRVESSGPFSQGGLPSVFLPPQNGDDPSVVSLKYGNLI